MSETSDPQVTVIVPTYNRAGWLPGAVRSAWGQSLRAVEILIVDDGSDDDTPQVVAELERTDSRVRGIRQENAGPSGARNTALERAAAPWIAFLDDDDLWHPEALERMLRFAERRGAPAVASLAVTFLSEEPVLEASRVLADREALQVAPLLTTPPGPSIRLEDLLIRPLAPVNAGLFRRDGLQTHGGFRADLRSAEDYELWLRLCVDAPIPVIHEELALVRRHPSQASGVLLNMASGTRRILEEFLAARPDLAGRLPRRRLRRRLGFLAREEAYAALLESDSRRAARSAWRSVCYDPLGLKSWVYLGLAPWPSLHARLRPARGRASWGG